jgi:hypothetical protein
MARTRQKTVEASDPQPIGDAMDQVIGDAQQRSERDVFDEAIDAQRAAQRPTEVVQTQHVTEAPTTTHAERHAPIREPGDDGDEQPARNGITKRQYKPAPDPRGELTVQLSLEDPEFKARLSRSSRDNMWIQFSKNPGKEYTDQIREAGFDWKHDARDEEGFAKGAWIMHLDEGRKWQGHGHAQDVIYDVINQIRAKNGMEAFVPGAGQAV